MGESIALMNDNAVVAAYLKKQGWLIEVVDWSGLHMVFIVARCVMWKKNILANQLSHQGHVLPTEWSLLHQELGGHL